MGTKMKINPQGLLGTVATRQQKESATYKALGMEDPYAGEKKKKKKGGTLRFFMDKFISDKEKKNNSR